MRQVSKNILKQVYKPRPGKSRKYDFGLVLVIGGSSFYSGSPALNSLAAFRAGADMVKTIAPKRAADIISSFSPNLASYPLEGEYLGMEHVSTLLAMTESGKDVSRGKLALVIGGGLGRTNETRAAVIEYLSQVRVPAVIDADAIHAVAERISSIKNKNFILTPHSHEFHVLSGKEVAGKKLEQKAELVKREAARLGCIILLKGEIDVVSDGRQVVLNKTHTSYMTKGGTGDTLAGIAGALLARGTDPFLASQASAHINGRAGQLAGKEKKEGLLATDLIELIPKVF